MSEEKPVNTTTDMLVSMLANEDKLVDKGNRINYGNPKFNEETEKLESLMDEEETIPEQKHTNNVYETKNEPQNIKTVTETEKPEKTIQQSDEIDAYARASPSAKKLLKLDMIRKLYELSLKGAKLTADYDMNSDYYVMKYEYEIHIGIRAKHSTVEIANDVCLSSIKMMENTNKKYNPFGFQLDGWHKEMQKKSDILVDVIGDMYDKYQTPGRPMAPELKFLGLLVMGAVKTHVANTACEGSPSIEEQVKKNPDMLKSIINDATGTRSTKSIDNKPSASYAEKLRTVDDMRQLVNYEKEFHDAQQPTIRAPRMPSSLQQAPQSGIRNNEEVVTPSSLTNEQLQQIREQNAKEHYVKMVEKERQKNIDEIIKNVESKSQMSKHSNIEENEEESQISISEDIESIISEVSEKTKKKTNKDTKKKGVQKTQKKNNKKIKINI